MVLAEATGWCGDAFVMPHQAVGPPGGEAVLFTEAPPICSVRDLAGLRVPAIGLSKSPGRQGAGPHAPQKRSSTGSHGSHSISASREPPADNKTALFQGFRRQVPDIPAVPSRFFGFSLAMPRCDVARLGRRPSIPREPRPNGGLALASSSARNGRELRLRGRSLKVAASLLLPPTTFRWPGAANYLKWWS